MKRLLFFAPLLISCAHPYNWGQGNSVTVFDYNKQPVAEVDRRTGHAQFIGGHDQESLVHELLNTAIQQGGLAASCQQQLLALQPKKASSASLPVDKKARDGERTQQADKAGAKAPVMKLQQKEGTKK